MIAEGISVAIESYASVVEPRKGSRPVVALLPHSMTQRISNPIPHPKSQ
jgi:hypothetical protein